MNGTRPLVPFTIKEEIYRIMVKDRNPGLKRLRNGAWDVGVGTGEYLFQLLCDESVPDRLEPYLTRREGTPQCPQR